ncbi:hypothetical protein AGLY_001291 [Aphis glycines]|uniref:SWIM-type domain-containing protein n=1 Tax=Aphis glycines TaxID=307491 RepID=A0A6G0U9E0_APHGL|nr:hypothetical protein AGLY_001291 [Aphis glycines]
MCGKDNENTVVENTKAIVDFKFIHNHEIMRADVLKYRKPLEEVKPIFFKFFEEGKTLEKALFSFKTQLHIKKGNNYYIYAGDHGELPNSEWVYNLYYMTFNQYNDECSSTCALMETHEDGNFAIVIASSLMKRISSGIHESGEILFIDASGLLICTLILAKLEMFYQEVMNDDLKKQYSRIESYVVGLFQRHNEWALCLRQTLITHLDLRICSCPEGSAGKPCKHQIFVASNLNVDLKLYLSTNEETRKKITLGSEVTMEENENIENSESETARNGLQMFDEMVQKMRDVKKKM